MSPEAQDFSLDESFDSEDDSDHYEEYSSDAGLLFNFKVKLNDNLFKIFT